MKDKVMKLLMGKISKYCPECGEAKLEFFESHRNTGQAVDGRLHMSEVSTDFVLGCMYCSETIEVFSQDHVSEILTSLLSEKDE